MGSDKQVKSREAWHLCASSKSLGIPVFMNRELLKCWF